MKVEWSADALADLDRFAIFLHDKFPALAARVRQEIIAKTQLLAEHPLLGGRWRAAKNTVNSVAGPQRALRLSVSL
jgi:plasmid stabilization system protein ParE